MQEVGERVARLLLIVWLALTTLALAALVAIALHSPVPPIYVPK